MPQPARPAPSGLPAYGPRRRFGTSREGDGPTARRAAVCPSTTSPPKLPGSRSQVVPERRSRLPQPERASRPPTDRPPWARGLGPAWEPGPRESPRCWLGDEGERPVNDLARLLGLAQPQVSKHLRVLREVGVVAARDEGRQRVYRLNGHSLKPIHDWVEDCERAWRERLDQLDVVYAGSRPVISAAAGAREGPSGSGGRPPAGRPASSRRARATSIRAIRFRHA